MQVTGMRVEIVDDHQVVIHHETWRARLIAACLLAVGGALLWQVPAEVSTLGKFFLGAFGATAVALAGIMVVGPVLESVHIQGKEGQVFVCWTSLWRASVEQIRVSAVASIDIFEHVDEEGTRTYEICMKLKSGRRLPLALDLRQRPVLLHHQIERALAFRTGGNSGPD
jgi:hypothetical protein